ERGASGWSSRSCGFLLERDVGDGRARDGDVTPQRPVVEPERVLAGGERLEHGSVERPAGDRPLVDLLVGALGVPPGGADLDLHAVQVRSGVEDERSDARPEIQHHVLGPSVRGVVVVVAHDDGVSYPSWGVPRYGNVDW